MSPNFNVHLLCSEVQQHLDSEVALRGPQKIVSFDIDDELMLLSK